MAKKTPSADDLQIGVGDYVLAGGGRAALPATWFLGKVLWVGKDDVFIERSIEQGQTYRQHLGRELIRASGTIEELSKLKELARKDVRDLAARVDEAESALGRAREAVWSRLDELRGAGLRIAAAPAVTEPGPSFYATVDDEVREN